MSVILAKFKSQLNSIFNAQAINPCLCGVLARVTRLKKHSDSALNPYILAVALVEVFLESGVHTGSPNSFNLETIYQSYDATVKCFNEKRKGSHKRKLKPLTKDGLMYYLKKPAFEEFSKRLFEKVFAFKHNQILTSKMRIEGQLLLQSLNLLFTNNIKDVIANDGFYKIVNEKLHNEFKGARTAKKDLVKKDGSLEKAKNAQLGVQTAFSIVNDSPINIDISSGVDNEREYVQVKQSKLHILDAGYYSAEMIDAFDDSNAYIVVRGRTNLVGRLNKIVIDGFDRSDNFSIGNSLEFNKALLPSLDKPVDMELTIEYKKESKKFNGSKVKVKRQIRAIRFEDEKNKGKPAFIITNLPWAVSADVVLTIMRLRWSIELYFKELKSHTRYRAALTNNKSLTVGFVYFSMLTHLLRDCVLQTVERHTGTAISLQKVVSRKVVINGEKSSLSLAIGRIMVGRYCYYTNNSFESAKEVIMKVFSKSLVILKKSALSVKNKYHSLDSKIVYIADKAIKMNPFGRETKSIQDLLCSFVESRQGQTI